MAHSSPRLLALSVFVLITSVLVWNYSKVKTEARWLLSSRHYKSEVLSQPTPPTGELKHIEWDGWGWGGQDTTVYLVFDPTNALSTARESRPAECHREPLAEPDMNLSAHPAPIN